MKVITLIKGLQKLKPDSNIVFSSDEELNQMFCKAEIASMDKADQVYVVYPLSGSEVGHDDLYERTGEAQ